MSRFKPMDLLSKLSGKLCSHSDMYFAERNGTQYTGKICNPYMGQPTENQLIVRNNFASTIVAINALTDEQKQAYIAEYANPKNRKQYKTLRGFIFAQEYAKIINKE